MSSQSITPVRRLSPASSRDAVELVDPPAPRGFVSFQYSYTEVSSRDGRTHVRSNKTRFADGKLTREAFESELEGDAYGNLVEETHRHMLRSLSWFLPWGLGCGTMSEGDTVLIPTSLCRRGESPPSPP